MARGLVTVIEPAPRAQRTSGAAGTGGGENPAERIEFEFDITVVDGEAGRRLAVLQSEVILDVLTWLHDHQRAKPSSA
jgi:hypothetical protein